MLTASLMAGPRASLFEAFDPATTPERMAAEGATLLGSAVPFFLAYFDAQRRHGDTPLFPRLRALLGGGAPTPAEINRMAREILGSTASPAPGGSPSSRSRRSRHPTHRSPCSTTRSVPPWPG